MTAFADVEEAIELLDKVIRLSFANHWNVHSAVGGKYGELFVAKELWEHQPLIGKERKIRGADVFLARTGKRIEAKWGMLHHEPDDYYFKVRGSVPYWGWGFSKGNQFLRNRFDYCVMLAARRNEAAPQHVFVLTLGEMRKGMGLRVSGEAGKKARSYFIETSDDSHYFEERARSMKSKFGSQLRELAVEESLLDRESHRRRWKQLINLGRLTA